MEFTCDLLGRPIVGEITQGEPLAFELLPNFLEQLTFSSGKKWGTYIQDTPTNHPTFCWHVTSESQTFYSVESAFSEVNQRALHVKFTELSLQGDSRQLSSISKELLNHISSGASIVDLSGNSIQNNALFRIEDWVRVQDEIANSKVWRQACLDAICLKSSRFFRVEESTINAEIKLLNTPESGFPLFILKLLGPDAENTSSSNELLPKSLDSNTEDVAELHNQIDFYKSVLDGIPADIAVFDQHHRYLFLNPNAIKDPELRTWMVGKTDLDYCIKRGLDSKMAEERSLMFNTTVSTKNSIEFITEHKKGEDSTFVLRKYHPCYERDELKLVIGYGIDITEVRKAHLEVSRQERRFRHLFEINPTMIFILDENFRVISANPAACKGVSIEEFDLLDKHFVDFIPEPLRPGFGEKFGNLISGSAPTQTCDCELMTSLGNRLVEFNAERIISIEGVVQVILVGTDITEQRSIQQKLKESELFGKRLLDEIQSNILVVNSELKFIFLNQFAKSWLEMDSNGLNDFSLEACVVEEDREVLRAHLENYIHPEFDTSPLRISVQCGLNKRIRQVQVFAHSFEFDNHPCFYLTMIDITELETQVKQREEAEELARTIINTSLDSVVTSDEEGRIVGWSNKAVVMFGYKEEEVMGRKISETIIPEEMRPYHDAGIARMKTATTSNVTGRLLRLKSIHKNGHEFPVELFINQIDVKGKKLFTAFIRDITDRVKAEASLIQSEQRMSFLLSSLPAVPFASRLHTFFEFTYLHNRIFDLSGFEAKDLLSQRVSWKNQIHPQDLESVLTAINSLSSKSEAIVEYRFTTAEGKIVWIRNSMKVNYNENSLPDSVTGIFEDISDFRAKEITSSLLRKVELEILQLDWKDYSNINAFCVDVSKRINRDLDFSQTAIWDYDFERKAFHCLASSQKEMNLKSFSIEDELFLDRLHNEIYIHLESGYLSEKLSAQTNGNCLVTAVKRDGKVTGLLVFEAEKNHFNWTGQFKQFIKSIANELSLVAESFLRRSVQEKLQSALLNGKMVVLEWQRKNDFIEWPEGDTASFSDQLWDVPPKSMHELLQLVYSDDLVHLSSEFEKLNEKQGDVQFDFRLNDKEGKLQYFELNLTLRDNDHDVIGVLRDVSKRTKAEKELQRISEGANQLNSVIAALQMATNEEQLRKEFSSQIIDKISISDCFFVSRHESSSSYLRIDQKEELHKNVKRIQDELLNDHLSVLDQAWQDGSPIMKEVILESTSKKLTQFIVIPFAIIDEVESLIIAYCTEIEGQSEARAEFMMKCVDVLKQRIIKIRSAASMNKLNTELKTSNHQLQQYSYIVSHNLRAPISNLHGILNLLTPESVVNERDKVLFVKLNETVRSIDRILIELNELLMVKDALNVTLEKIHLRELVDSVVKTLESDFQTVHAEIEIDFSIKEDITAYKPYVISIFQNLLSNAYKFRSVDRRLKVKIESDVDSNGETIITFSDNGIGIDMERNKERVFRLYSRFHRHVQGTGMGLYLIKEQLKAMGGEIEIESAVDKGTKFIMHFKK